MRSKIYAAHLYGGRPVILLAGDMRTACKAVDAHGRGLGPGYIDLTDTWLGEEIAEQVQEGSVRRVELIQDGLSGGRHIQFYRGYSDPL